MADDNWKWLAFISYKHDDIEWARWLQDMLERYRLPSYLTDEYPDIPKDLRPIFRDETDLPLGYLTDNIIAALRQSIYLIVICSTSTPESDYVRDEVQEFINLGKEREGKIIPFIINGEPKNCYPKPILELSKIPLGANVNEISKDYAAVKVIAKLLGDIAVDKLWMRHLKVEAEEKERLLAEKRRLQMVQSRFLAKEAEILIEQGDTCTASMLLINALPKDINDPTDRPLTKEALDALRNVFYRERSGLPYITNRLRSGINTFEISPDGRYAALGLFSEVFFSIPVVSVIDLNTGEQINIAASTSGFPFGVNIVHFSFDGTYLLAGYYLNDFRIWDTKTWKSTSFNLKKYISSFYSATWLGAKNTLAIAGGNVNCEGHYAIIFLNVENNTCRTLAVSGKGIVQSIISSNDGKYVAYDTQECLYILDVSTGQHLLHMNLPEKMHLNYKFNPDKSDEVVISSKEDRKLFFLNIGSRKTKPLSNEFDHAGALAFTTDGNCLAWGTGKTVCRFDLKSHVIEGGPARLDDDVICITFSSDGNYLSYAARKGVYCYNIHTNITWCVIEYVEKDITCVDLKFISDTYKLAIISNDRKTSERLFRVIDLSDLFELTVLNVICVELSADCRYLAYCNNNDELYVADISNMKTTRLKKMHSGLCNKTRPIIFSKDSRYMATLHVDGTLCIFDLDSGKESSSGIIKETGYRNLTRLAYAKLDELVVFLDNQSKIAFVVDEYVCVWDFISNVRTIRKLEFEASHIVYNNTDNSLVIIGSDTCIWKLSDDRMEYQEISCLACDGKHIVLLNGKINKFHVVNIETGDDNYVERQHHVKSMAISPDGKYLAMETVSCPNIFILNLKTREEYTLDRYTDSDISMSVNMYFEKTDNVLVSVCDTGITRWFLETGEKEVYNNAQWVCANGMKPIKALLKDGRIRLMNHISDDEMIRVYNERFKLRSLTDEEKQKYYLTD